MGSTDRTIETRRPTEAGIRGEDAAAMADQEHNTGRNEEHGGEPASNDSGERAVTQPAKRHAWGSKARAQRSPSENQNVADTSADRTKPDSGNRKREDRSVDRVVEKNRPRSGGGSYSSQETADLSVGVEPRRAPSVRTTEPRQEREPVSRRSDSDRSVPNGKVSDRSVSEGSERRPTRDSGARSDPRGSDRRASNERGAQTLGSASRGGPAGGTDPDRQARYGTRGGPASGAGSDRQPRSGGRSDSPGKGGSDRQSRFGGRDESKSDRTSDSGRTWAPRSSSDARSGGGGRRTPDSRAGERTPFRRPTDRQDRGNSPERRSDDRRGAPRSSAPSAGPREPNARDLRSANRPDRERSPEIDEDVKGDELDRVTRAQVRNLEERSAAWVAKHLVMAGRLIDDEPELAFQHALAASRRGGRLAAVREAVGLTAYAAGHYGEALREFRTFRRISGSNVHLPVMADCERGLGRPDRALDLARTDEAASLDVAGAVELAMVVSGARADLGQTDAAVSALEIPQLDLHRAFSYSPRLFRAYADALDAAGRSGESGKWRRQADVADKALGIIDDVEPDIIDLGEDDEPDASPVPRVAEVLAPATRGVHQDGPSDDADPAAGPMEDVGNGEDIEDIEADTSDDGGDGEHIEVTTSGDDEALTSGDGGDIGGIEDEVSTSGGDENLDVDSEVVDDELSRGRTTEAAAPLQTEMLFSLDGTDAEGESIAAGAADSATVTEARPRRKAPKRETPSGAPTGQDVIDE